MMFYATYCPKCRADVSVLVSKHLRCDGRCTSCGAVIVSAKTLMQARPVTLSPCPICGGCGMGVSIDYAHHGSRPAVMCTSCGFTAWSPTMEATGVWNTLKRD